MKVFEVFLPSDHVDIDLWALDYVRAPYTVEGEVEDVLIDRVYAVDSVTEADMATSLIYHDGYPQEITVVEAV